MPITTITQISITPNQMQSLIEDAVMAAIKKNNGNSKPDQLPTFSKIPITEIFEQRILSKPTFYSHVKTGKIKLYKLGGRSYVDAIEFNNVFRAVEVK